METSTPKTTKTIPLHVKILLGMLGGVLWGLVHVWMGWSGFLTLQLIKPFGTIFIKMLKMVAAPLVLASLVAGVASIKDIKDLAGMGGKTILIYMSTTVVAVCVGLGIAGLINPGKRMDINTRNELLTLYNTSAEAPAATAAPGGWLKPLEDMVPENAAKALTDNSGMLQVVFFALLIGIALAKMDREKGRAVREFFVAFNEVMIKITEMAMKLAPLGVFALMSSLVIEISGNDAGKAFSVMKSLAWYAGTVLLGLGIMVGVIYPLLIKLFTKISPILFFKAMRPVQLLAFSTSSSNATLPLTIETCEKDLGVPEKVSGFVLPLGATINMDGTILYQAVATVFIAQALGMDLSWTQQLTVVLTATLASIGTAGVPGAGILMLVIVLESIGVPVQGIALILGIDRLLDMFRTVVNVSGDVSTALIVAAKDNKE